VEICGKPVVGLLDSGANCTVLGENGDRLVKALGLNINEIGLSIKTADGAKHIARHYADIPYVFQNQCHIIPTLLVPTLSRTLILGMDFWSKFKLSPTISSLTINEIQTKKLNISEELTFTIEQELLLENAINQFIYTTSENFGRTHILKHDIITEGHNPVKQRHYPVSPYVQKQINNELDRMLGLDVIEPSCSPWSSPIVSVPKKNGRIRLCLDSRKLNDRTKRDAYPLPSIAGILGRFSGTEFLSTIDLSDAFWQIPLCEEAKEKTAFTIPGRGLFHFKVMPFGLTNAPQTQARLMDLVLGVDLQPSVFAYLDDIVIATNTFSEHLKMLTEVSKRLKMANLTISREKSKFCCSEVKYLGYIIDRNGLRTDPGKIECIVNYPSPKNVRDVRQFLGMSGWYRRFITDFSSIVAPISDLLRKPHQQFNWTKEADNAFRVLKSRLISAPILRNPDFSKPFIVQCDASDLGVGAILTQDDQVVAFMSKKLTSTERKYSATERECLAVLYAVEKFRHYIEGIKFTVVTDHSALLWLLKLKDPIGRLGRWTLKLQHFDFELVHRKGKYNVVADALSRSIFQIDQIETNEDKWYNNLSEKIEKMAEKFPDFKSNNGKIYKKCRLRDELGTVSYQWKVVVPKHERNLILQKYHDDPLASHFGYTKTYDRIQREFYWPKMSNDIHNYINKCQVCKAIKPTNYVTTPTMGKQRIANRPWEMVSTDFMGPFPRSKRGNTMLLVITDQFSKFPLLFPLREANQKTLIKIVEENLFFHYGVPSVLISDNGSQFTGLSFQELLKLYSVNHWLTPRYHPQSNPTERVNQVIGTSIRAYINKDHRDWDLYVQQIGCAIRNAKHESITCSPYYANYGFNMSLKGNRWEEGKENLDERTSPVMVTHLKAIHEHVRIKLNEAYMKHKQQYNLRPRASYDFAVGDTVWKRNFVQSDAVNKFSSKLAPKYIKCTVLERRGSNSYALQDQYGKYLGIFHAKDIKKD
jgi:transposase InsO family protein